MRVLVAPNCEVEEFLRCVLGICEVIAVEIRDDAPFFSNNGHEFGNCYTAITIYGICYFEI